jgi:hypothetical protein
MGRLGARGPVEPSKGRGEGPGRGPGQEAGRKAGQDAGGAKGRPMAGPVARGERPAHSRSIAAPPKGGSGADGERGPLRLERSGAHDSQSRGPMAAKTRPRDKGAEWARPKKVDKNMILGLMVSKARCHASSKKADRPASRTIRLAMISRQAYFLKLKLLFKAFYLL